MIKKYSGTNEIADSLAQILLEIASVNDDRKIHIALSGGNTPKLIFCYLAENYCNRLNDNRFHFWWGDDRCVPSDNDDSNFKWAFDLWLKPIGTDSKNIHRVMGENNPEEESVRYENEIKKTVTIENGLPCFDLIMLGLGNDGHTASIFPDHEELLSCDQLCAVATHPVTSQKRITFTGRLINNARHIIFVVTGKDKAGMVKNVVEDSVPDYPASHIKPVHGTITWFLDEQAASLIKNS